MRAILILISLTCFNIIYAQIIDNTSAKLFAEDPIFNSKFIKNNRIKSIIGHYSTKASLDQIRSTTNIYMYEFNERGLLIKDYKTILNDTIVRMYQYDNKDNLSLIRKTDKYGFHSYHYKYDSLNRTILKQYRRDINSTYNKVKFNLDKSFIISDQTFGYKTTNSGTEKLYYNTAGKIYKTELFSVDEHGYLIKQEAHSVTGSNTGKVEFLYNENGLIKEKKTTSYLTNDNTTRVRFEYDSFDNLLAQHYYRNQSYRTEYQVVYNSSTLLLSALLFRDIETNIITILKFSEYLYFEN